MRKLLLALTFVAAASPAFAESCVYWNAINPDTVSVTGDGMELAHIVTEGATITCRMAENTFAVGPFPYECTNGEAVWEVTAATFPTAEGEPAGLLLYDNLIWYRRCA
jgi:hypothetical protein